MSENKTWNIKIQGGIQITSPADINNLVTYVLLEQDDWCEPVIEFVRKLIQPGMNCLDMDTGYGVYALTMAQEMEGEGKVIALNTHEHFSQSVQENGLQKLITTELDDSPLDFIRLGDVELDENLIQQGDPLIMFPAQRLQYLRDQGLDIYCYIPGLKALAFLQDDASAKGNLFACTRDRADKLRKLGLLTDSLQEELQPSITWKQYLPQFPYIQSLLQLWETSSIDPGYEQAINLYVSSQDPNLTLDQRYRLLRQSREALSSLNKAGDTHAATIVSLIRAYADLGERHQVASTAGQLLKDIGEGKTIKMNQPFIPPHQDFDQRPVQQNLGKWLSAVIMYAFEKHRAYTSYHNPQQHLGVLSQGKKLPDSPLEIQRRLALCAMKLGKNVNIQEGSRLLGVECLNAHVWKEFAELNQESMNRKLTMPRPTASSLDKENKSVPQQVRLDSKVEDPSSQKKGAGITTQTCYNLVLLDLCDRPYTPDTPYNKPLGGMRSAFAYLAEALASNGHNVYFCTKSPERGIIRGVNCPGPNLDASLLSSVDAVMTVAGVSRDLLLRLREKMKEDAPLVLWTGHAHDQPASKYLKDNDLFNFLDTVFVVGSWQASKFINTLGAPEDKISYLRNAVSPPLEEIAKEIAKDPLNAKQNPPRLVYTSTPFRGLDVLVSSFPFVQEKLPDVTLDLYTGMSVYQMPEQDEKFRPLYEKAKSLSGINHHGPVPQTDLATALKKSWVLAYPNHWPETSCIAVMEAMGAGAKVVTTSLGALPETCAGFGKLIDLSPKDPEFSKVFAGEVVDTCRKIQNGDPEIREELKNQVEFVLDNYVWSKRAKEFEEWLRGWKDCVTERLDSESEAKEELPFETTKVQASVKGMASFNVIIPKREQFRIRDVFVNEDYALPRELQAKSGMTIVDVGANVGCFTLYASTWAKNLNIHCFEPNPQVQELLRENLKPLEKDHNVKIHPFALGEKDDELKLNLDPNNTGRSSFVLNNCGDRIQCIVRHTELALEEAGIKTIDVLKIDVEGYETQVLKGLGSYLKKAKVILLEYHEENQRREIDKILNEFCLYSAKIENLRGNGILKYINNLRIDKKYVGQIKKTNYDKILCVGFPKAGTLTLSKALSYSNFKDAHWKVGEGNSKTNFCGYLMYQGYYQYDDPWYYLREYQAITQADVCMPDMNLNYWPQLDFDILKRAKDLYPSCLFVLNHRDPQNIVSSIQRWGDFQKRLTKADIPGLPPGKGKTPDELQAWIENHYAKLREFFKDDDNFLEIDIESEDAPKILGDKLGIEIKWWGKTNVNPGKTKNA